ncbi:hypothetical protein G9409_09225 [Chlorobium sp. BLA1]|uniref:hypothetical protein n=1 Tax=Candidatus Chlorobium masyuteum TaxID=2716876 RepID=UPI00142433F9|nr:hypothetical protein [Candidatus Chlorobium masyuteum]NHQ60759.1 hypothetical protein [Candidatus Chlorobium masyuteum]
MKRIKQLAIVAVALCMALVGTAHAEVSVDRNILPFKEIPCPNPVHIALNIGCGNPTYPYAPDFRPPGPNQQFDGMCGSTINKIVKHTFEWKLPSKCCQFVSGTLSITVKALQKGISHTSNDAGNDKAYILKNGTELWWKYIYPIPPTVTVGQQQTVTVPVTAAMVTGNRISFAVQDDSSVLSAKLDLNYCCVDDAGCK